MPKSIDIPETGLDTGALPYWQHGDLFPAVVIGDGLTVEWLPLGTPLIRYCVTCHRPHEEASVTGVDGRYHLVLFDLKDKIGECLDCQRRARENRLPVSTKLAEGTDYALDLCGFPKNPAIRHFGFGVGTYPSDAWDAYAKTSRIFLWGKAGQGKTSTASAIARRVLQLKFERRRGGGNPYWIYCKDFYGMDLDAARTATADAQAADLLVIDDLFSANDSQTEKTELGRTIPHQAYMHAILDARYRDNKPTIVTAGRPLRDLQGYLGDSIARRLLDDKEHGNFVHYEVRR